jgi:hypothetical protein
MRLTPSLAFSLSLLAVSHPAKGANQLAPPAEKQAPTIIQRIKSLPGAWRLKRARDLGDGIKVLAPKEHIFPGSREHKLLDASTGAKLGPGFDEIRVRNGVLIGKNYLPYSPGSTFREPEFLIDRKTGQALGDGYYYIRKEAGKLAAFRQSGLLIGEQRTDARDEKHFILDPNTGQALSEGFAHFDQSVDRAGRELLLGVRRGGDARYLLDPKTFKTLSDGYENIRYTTSGLLIAEQAGGAHGEHFILDPKTGRALSDGFEDFKEVAGPHGSLLIGVRGSSRGEQLLDPKTFQTLTRGYSRIRFDESGALIGENRMSSGKERFILDPRTGQARSDGSSRLKRVVDGAGREPLRASGDERDRTRQRMRRHYDRLTRHYDDLMRHLDDSRPR